MTGAGVLPSPSSLWCVVQPASESSAVLMCSSVCSADSGVRHSQPYCGIRCIDVLHFEEDRRVWDVGKIEGEQGEGERVRERGLRKRVSGGG